MMFRSFRDTEPFKIDRNGTKYYHDYTCRRCGGAGALEQWKYTGCICYECGGSGRSTDHPYKVYTPEYAKKLEEQRAKREAKRIAKAREEASERNAEILEKHGFNENKETFVILGNTYEIKDELKASGFKFDYVLGWHGPEEYESRSSIKITADEVFEENVVGTLIVSEDKTEEVKAKIKAANDELAKKNDSTEFVGEIGKRIEITLTLDRVASFETQSYTGYGTTVVLIYNFTDEHGNALVWKTSGGLDKIVDGEVTPIKNGETFRCKATVKDHNVYRNKKQTVLQRVKVIA